MVHTNAEASPFGARLREERKRLKLTQSAFGAIGGVTTESQGNYERGARRPDSAYLEAIAAHGVDVTYLLTGTRTSACPTQPIAQVAGGEGVYVLRGHLQRVFDISHAPADAVQRFTAAEAISS